MIDFPSNPTNGQVYANYIYDSSITAWRNVNTDTGIGTLNAMGLKNVVPTSVVVSSGSATTNSNGLVTFSGATNLDIIGVFNSTYKNYKIVLSGFTQSATGAYLGFRFLVNGSQHSASNHYQSGRVDDYTGTTSPYILNAADHIDIGSIGVSAYPQYLDGVVEVFEPNVNRKKKLQSITSGGASGVAQYVVTGQVDAAIISNGFRLYSSGGTMSGALTVYGYSN